MKLIWDLAVELKALTDPTPSETINICHNMSYSQITFLFTSVPEELTGSERSLQPCPGKHHVASSLAEEILAPLTLALLLDPHYFCYYKDKTITRQQCRQVGVCACFEIVIDLLKIYLHLSS